MQRRVVITGMGVISSAGNDLETFTRAISSGESSLSLVNNPELAHFGARYAGLISDLDSVIPSDLAKWKSADRYVLLALIAAKEALTHAAIDPSACGPRMGLAAATCSGPMLTIENQLRLKAAGKSTGTPETFRARQYYSMTDIVARAFGISGPQSTITTACSASTAAIGIASDWIRAGVVDMVLTGGSDSFSPTTFAGFAGLKALSESKCAPFSKPIGLNLGEGAGFLVLESMDHALERGATILGELCGYGLSNDAYHCSAPDPSGKGAASAMGRALQSAGIPAQRIVYVNAHGTGTEANDKSETKALKRVFEEKVPPVSSTKSIVGHCLGAAGSIELIASIACGRKGILPPTANFTVPREGCTLDYIPEPKRPMGGSVFIKNNFAFGGNNASLVVDLKPSDLPAQKELMNDELCITSIGIACAAGVGMANISSSTGNLFSKRQGIAGEITIAEVPLIDVRTIDRRIDSRLDRAGLLASIAVADALRGAHLSERPSERQTIGFYLGIANGSTWAEADHITKLLNNNFQITQVASFPFIVPNSIAGSVCRTFALTGHNTTFCTGEGSSLETLVQACIALKNNHASQFLCGGVDSLHENYLDNLVSAGFVSSKAPPAEASVMYFVESRSSAEKRGAPIIASICGFAMSGTVQSGNQGIVRVINEAVDRAGISKSEIGMVCCSRENSREMEVAGEFFPDSEIVDASLRVGNGAACGPLLNLSLALNKCGVDDILSRKYILTLFRSNLSNSCALVVKQQNGPQRVD